MKYLVLLLVVLAAWGLSRVLRGRVDGAGSSPRRGTTVGHEELPACAQCGLHLPRSEALAGPDGFFCCEAHRLAFVARKPPA